MTMNPHNPRVLPGSGYSKGVKPFNPRWQYTGDINLEHGGLFFRPGSRGTFPEIDYVEAVNVTPITDGGGPDNLYLVEVGSIYMDAARIEEVLATCGYSWAVDETGLGYVVDNMGSCYPVNRRTGLTCLVDAYRSYFGVERDAMGGEHWIQVGAEQEGGQPGCFEDIEPDYVLRRNASLLNFVKRTFL